MVDCRYEFEFTGGHIEGAINIATPKRMERCVGGQHIAKSSASRLEGGPTIRCTCSSLAPVGYAATAAAGRTAPCRAHSSALPRLPVCCLVPRFLRQLAPADWGRTALLLHCEYSGVRAPRMLRHVRELGDAAASSSGSSNGSGSASGLCSSGDEDGAPPVPNPPPQHRLLLLEVGALVGCPAALRCAAPRLADRVGSLKGRQQVLAQASFQSGRQCC